MGITKQFIEEDVIAGKSLGRHVFHDSLSWRYPAPMADKIKSVKHEPVSGNLPLDQGNLGSCTGNAMVGMLMSAPFYDAIKAKVGRELTEDDAISIYSDATHVDHFRGLYPPEDTGSSGLAVCKAVQQPKYKRQWVVGYAHCFSLEHFLRTLVLQPCIAGTLWKQGQDRPDSDYIVHPTGNVRGGHEYVVDELVWEDDDPTSPHNLIGFLNSWGPGFAKQGHFYMPVPEFDNLRKQQGDVKTVIV
jgi:hypothetical protein